MPAPVLTALVIIFVIWLQYEIRKASRKMKKETDNFWDREKQSNLSRRKDISALEYLTITTESLPMDDKEDQTANSYRDTILKLSDQKILNLTGYTNTELKTMYGVANMNRLAEYDNNFTVLVSILQKWAERLYAGGYAEDSRAVLEYAVSCKTDVSKTYKLLAVIYKEQNAPEKIDALIHGLASTAIRNKEELIRYLQELTAS
jgi:hypothetical protein